MGDFRRTNGEELPLTDAERRKKRRKWLALTIAVLAAIVAAGMLVRVDRYAMASGYVTTEEYAEVHPPVTGIVSKICVSSGDMVEAGQVMVELNSAEEEALLSESRARVSKLKTEMERRRAEMDIDLERRSVELSEQKREHDDALRVADLELRNAQTKLELTRELVSKGLKAAANLEDDQLKAQLAEVNLQALRQKDFSIFEELLQRDRLKYDREIEALKDELAALEDAVKRVEARLELRKIRAPISGQVVRYEFVVGELLQPSGVIYEIFGGDQKVLKLRVGERHAIRLAEGQPYRARLTSIRGIWNIYFRGEVRYLRNVIQADGANTYRMAYCSFDDGGYDIPPGTTAEARIYYDRSSFWSYLFNLEP